MSGGGAASRRRRGAVAAAWLLVALGAGEAWSQRTSQAPSRPGKGQAVRSAPRCRTPQGEAIPAQKILTDLADGKDIDINGRIIDGNLDSELIGPPPDGRKVSLHLFRGRLRLDSCRVNGRISFPQTVMGELMLTCAEVLGDVDIRESEIRGGISADGARIGGRLTITRTHVERDLSLRGATLEDGVEVSGSSIHSVSLSGANVRRDVDIARSVLSGLDLTQTAISGAVRLDDLLVVTDVAASGSTIDGGLRVSGLRARGGLILNGATMKEGLGLSAIDIGGTLYMSVTLEGPLSMSDLRIGGNMSLLDALIGEAAMSGVRVTGASEWAGARFTRKTVIEDSDFGRSFNAHESVFDGDVLFRRVRFPGEDPMKGATFAYAPSLVDTTLPRPPHVQMPEPDEAAEDEDLLDRFDDQEP